MAKIAIDVVLLPSEEMMAKLLHEISIVSTIEEGRKLTTHLAGGEVKIDHCGYLRFTPVTNSRGGEAYRISTY